MTKRAGKLMSTLHKRDDGLVPEFIRALRETDQMKVLRVLGLHEGLHTFVFLVLCH